MNTFKRLPFLLLLGLLLAAGPARALITIEITEGVEGALPIAVVPFGWEGAGALPEELGAIVAADLHRSGRFAPLAEQDLIGRPHAGHEVNFKDWRLVAAESLVVGRVSQAAPELYRVQFQLFDVFKGKQLAGYSFSARANELRRVAHRISDIVYQQLTGERGAFSTRIAYISSERDAEGKEWQVLQVADADGYGAQTILRSPEPLMSPAWSPDARRLAYVSFENGRSEIFVQDVLSGARESVSSQPGLNGAPAWSPDGRSLALTLSRDGNPDIYVLDLAGRALRRLTNNAAIDTEPVWSADGRELLFTSDRGGRPQIYRIAASGGPAQRVTFEGTYNARPALSADGRQLAMVHGDRGRYRIAVMELESRSLRVLTDGTLDESPSFAPNGAMILYATEHAGRGVLAAVSVDGRVRQRLTLTEGEVREPAWSPFTD